MTEGTPPEDYEPPDEPPRSLITAVTVDPAVMDDTEPESDETTPDDDEDDVDDTDPEDDLDDTGFEQPETHP